MATFLNDIDTDKVSKLMRETTSNVEYFEHVVSTVTTVWAEDLDEVMDKIYQDILLVDQPPLNTLEKHFLELSNCLYYMGEKLERLGVYDVMSKNAYKEVYNKSYLNQTDIGDTKKKPTVAELTAQAENYAQYENIVSDVYAKAYKIVKNKVDAATTMLNSISKIISKRMTEMQLNSITPTGKQILNEDFSSKGNPYTISPSSYSNYSKVEPYTNPVQGSGRAWVDSDNNYHIENA